MANNGETLSQAELLFMQLVSMFQMAAMQQMGKLIDPVTQEASKDLDQARMSIDMIEMLKAKTEGNLSESETEFLKTILFELQMNYVDEVEASKKKEQEPEEGKEDEETEKKDASAEGADGDADQD